MSKLVIVESPAKAKTIKKYLGRGYEVMASMGHVRDLPKSRLGIDVENNFQPDYIDIRGKGDLEIHNFLQLEEFLTYHVYLLLLSYELQESQYKSYLLIFFLSYQFPSIP